MAASPAAAVQGLGGVQAAAAGEWVHVDALRPWEKNPRRNDAAVPKVAASIRHFGFVAPVVVWPARQQIVAGHTRVLAVRSLLASDPEFVPRGAPAPGMVRVIRHDFADEREAEAYAIADNRLGELAEWDADMLQEQLAAMDEEQRALVGFGDDDGPVLEPEQGYGTYEGPGGVLAKRFGAPPMSVLDARQGYWRERKEQWHTLFDAARGRENLTSTVASAHINRGNFSGGSIFDPVLAELALRWFCTPGGHVLDPFGGEATKGIVAGVLGYHYTAVELRGEQVAANRDTWTEVSERLRLHESPRPQWLQGDSERLGMYLPPGAQYDLVWTSPPYYDLEIYSESEKDGSTFETYELFIAWYERIFAQCVQRLRDNRFLAVKIGEVRDKRTGRYRNFVGDNIAIFQRLGLAYYNEAVLVTPLGSAPIRASMNFQAGRKLVKTHQNVLVFYKGDPRQIGDHFPQVVEAGELPYEDELGETPA